MDDHHLLASSGEGTIQTFDLLPRRPDIQTEVYESELDCMVRVSPAISKIREVFKKLPNCVSGHFKFWPKFHELFNFFKVFCHFRWEKEKSSLPEVLKNGFWKVYF